MPERVRTDNAIQHDGAISFDKASFHNCAYTDRILGGAGRVLGRAKGAPISAFSTGDNLLFDILFSSLPSNQFRVLVTTAVTNNNNNNKREKEENGGVMYGLQTFSRYPE